MPGSDEILLVHMGGLGDVCLAESAFLSFLWGCAGAFVRPAPAGLDMGKLWQLRQYDREAVWPWWQTVQLVVPIWDLWGSMWSFFVPKLFVMVP